ncbi:MAG TPA: CHAD domain-containing protein [Frateuria sp.]|uniref:CHAD domain-containing protein n=1 Tax=Frateuria sp. TaxID=2211372 RepID=UPI002DEA9F39|nr:CHAD domain-containing protein [Frateuria sp.]
MSSRTASELAEKMRAMVRRECAAILRALASLHRVHLSIHRARKSIRHLRALLSLVDYGLAEAAAIDRVLERLGDSLSTLRDAHVIIATAETLAASDTSKQWQPAIDRLVQRRDALVQRSLARDIDFHRRRAAVERAARQLDDMAWARVKPKDIQQRLAHSSRRVAKAETRAKADPTTQNLHRWRRRVRKLRMQIEALSEIAPEIVQNAVKESASKKLKELHRLSDQLGALRDEQMLRNVLRRMSDLPHYGEIALQLREQLALRESKLVKRAVVTLDRRPRGNLNCA